MGDGRLDLKRERSAREAIATVHAALNQGINLIDTAPVYGFGASEEIVGAALDGIRAQTYYRDQDRAGVARRQIYLNATAPASCKRSMIRCGACAPTLSTSNTPIGPDPLVPAE